MKIIYIISSLWCGTLFGLDHINQLIAHMKCQSELLDEQKKSVSIIMLENGSKRILVHRNGTFISVEGESLIRVYDDKVEVSQKDKGCTLL